MKGRELVRAIKDTILLSMGIISVAVGLECFLIPNHFIDGGVTGISLLISILFKVPLGFLLILINLPFIFLAYRLISKVFAIKTLVSVILLALVIAFIPFPNVTQDKLLIAVFGGFFLGLGIGLSIRGGSVLDGTEILAIAISKSTSLTIGDVILLINIGIFGCAAFLLNIETALYSMLSYFSASKTLDFVIHGIEEYVGVTLISEKYIEIKKVVIEKLGRGVTVYLGKKGLREVDIEIIYTVVTRLETTRLRNEIEKVDPTAFIIENPVNDAKGGMIKKLPHMKIERAKNK